jgi:tetrathionate reductase subunit B
MSSKKYAIAIDTVNCIDCKACMIACKVENKIPEGYWRNWVKDNRVKDGLRTQYQPGQCMQCDIPPCMSACPVDASHKDEHGLVQIDQEKCIGCGNCVTACPYGARYRDPQLQVADKCDFCSPRLSRGEDPACVATCPTKTRVFGDVNDPNSEICQLMKRQPFVRITNPMLDTEPNIFYSGKTVLLNWPREPTLPGGIHMSPRFWKCKT